MKAYVTLELSGPSGMVYTDVDDVRGNPGTVVIDDAIRVLADGGVPGKVVSEP